jgi:acyl dehydratase
MTALQPGERLPPRTVLARNTAAHEAGSIHDDAQAARAGYRGGLVPGVTLLAYLTPSLIEAFGEAWPRRGRLRARFVRPVYDGEALAVRATVASRGGGDVALACTLERADGAACVEAQAACLLGEPAARAALPWRRAIPIASGRAPAPDGALPPLAPELLVPGEELSPLTYHLSHSDAVAWAARAGDGDPWYHEASPLGGRAIVHPALFARDPILLLRHNFARKATVHAETELAYQHAAWPGRDYTVYGYVAEVYERKGNSYAVAETLTVDEDGREIVRNRHTSVIRLRGEDATA